MLFVVSQVANWCLEDLPAFGFWTLSRKPATCRFMDSSASEDYLFKTSASGGILTKTDLLVCGIAQKIRPMPQNRDVMRFWWCRPPDWTKEVYLFVFLGVRHIAKPDCFQRAYWAATLWVCHRSKGAESGLAGGNPCFEPPLNCVFGEIMRVSFLTNLIFLIP